MTMSTVTIVFISAIDAVDDDGDSIVGDRTAIDTIVDDCDSM